MPTHNFYSWLMKQSDRNDPIGDLSNDVKRDKKAPIESDNIDTWSSHLVAAGASIGATEALEVAWKEYKGH